MTLLFFFRKNLIICLGSNILNRSLTFGFFTFSSFPWKKMAHSTIKQQKSTNSEKHNQHLILKTELKY